jgi:hypothetical protein
MTFCSRGLEDRDLELEVVVQDPADPGPVGLGPPSGWKGVCGQLSTADNLLILGAL